MDRDKISTATKTTTKVFKAYIIGIVLVYVGASILASQHIIEVQGNVILFGSAIVIGIVVVGYQGYMLYATKKTKRVSQ